VIQGLSANDEVVQNPPDSVIDGETARVVQPGEGGVPGVPAQKSPSGQGAQGSQGGRE
jgi:hypothetical protein